jgi:8-oxo-dGTP pyrophosphatase MutT (NUDIX family)
VSVRVLEDEWTPCAAYEVLVRDAWQERVREAVSRAQRIWDGRYYRVINASDMKGDATPLRLCLGTIRYRYIATFRVLHECHAREGIDPLNHLSTAGLIRTRDGKFLFGRRSQNGAIDLIGGGVQSDELEVESGSDIEASLRKEIFEELGVRSTQIETVRGAGVLLSSTSNVLVVAAVDLTLSMDEVAAQFADRSDDEMSELVAINEDDLSTFLGSMSDCRTLIPTLVQRS